MRNRWTYTGIGRIAQDLPDMCDKAASQWYKRSAELSDACGFIAIGRNPPRVCSRVDELTKESTVPSRLRVRTVFCAIRRRQSSRAGLILRLVLDGFRCLLDEGVSYPQNWSMEIQKSCKNSQVVVWCPSHQQQRQVCPMEIKIALDAADEHRKDAITF